MATETLTATLPSEKLTDGSSTRIPDAQAQLLLHQAKHPYQVEDARDVPKALSGELLVQVRAIGLNPIDWKSAEYGFALPAFPCVNGREFVGKVIQLNNVEDSNIALGDTVLSVCTDYRDFRKSAFQQYAVVNAFNAIRIPPKFDSPRAASVGVAFVAATIALGICLGLPFSNSQSSQSLDLLDLSRYQDEKDIPEDVREEVLNAISLWNRPHTGDWILIYGASTVTGQVSIQLAKWGGLRVVAVADLAKHGDLLRSLGADELIDRKDLDKAAQDIHSRIRQPIRFALDTIGSETAGWCQDLLAARTGVQYRPSLLQSGRNNIILGPRSSLPHLVPIKLFHTNSQVGGNLSQWLSLLLENGDLKLPDTIFEDGGLDVIGEQLERLKSGELSGKRLVVRLPNTM